MSSISFCVSCGRNVYLETGSELTCPVCSSPLIPSETVTEHQAERIGRNEAWFRDVNERVVEEGVWSDQAVVCECGLKECSEFLDIDRDAYDEVRRFRDRFIIKPGHEIPGAEIVIKKRSSYYVAEKIGPGKRIAEETDPRAEE